MKKPKFSSVFKIYRMTLDLAGERAGSYKKSLLYFLVAFTAQGLAFGMFYPLLLCVFADHAELRDALPYLGWMVLFTGISCIASWKGYDFDYTGNIVDITHALRIKLGINLRKMPLEKLSAYQTGDLNSIFSCNVDDAVLHMGSVTAVVLKLVVVPVTITAVTFFVDWRLAVFMGVLFPLAMPVCYWMRSLAIQENTELSRANAALETGFIEYIQGLSVLRAVNKTGTNAQILQRAIRTVRSVQKKGLYKQQFPFVLMGVLMETILIVLLFLGAFFVLGNTLTLVTLGACILIVARITEPLALFLGVVTLFDVMDSAYKRIKSVLRIKPLATDTPTQAPERFDIVFDNVSFTYEGQDAKAIDAVSFAIPARTMTAIVGPSGGGKTTLTRLMMRYANPQGGSIRIGGVDIRKIDPDVLMRNLSVVFQDVYLFDDTILNNIKMAKPNATDEEVEAAVIAAHCHEFIARLPNGFDTKVGDIGGSLSGGERQRISIARAILKNAPIVILDEPTAALDTESEVAVQRAIDRLVEDKTVIVVAHRLSTIAGADSILVVDQGRIIERGNHGELVTRKGKYFTMWSAQQRVKAWQIDGASHTAC